MNFGRCQIRASAADDRSARIALPEGMASLVGLACWIEIRDEPHPELALRVDVSGLLGPVLTLWQGLRAGLSIACDIGDPRSSDFRFRLDPAPLPSEPGISLVCADLLALNRAWATPQTEPPRPEAVSPRRAPLAPSAGSRPPAPGWSTPGPTASAPPCRPSWSGCPTAMAVLPVNAAGSPTTLPIACR